MKYAEEKVYKEGKVIGDDILKVSSFVNEQIDIEFLYKVSEYFASEFEGIDKVLTIEASGIAYASMTAHLLGNLPLVIARKSKSKIIDPNCVYTAKIKSFTRGIETDVTVTKDFLKEGERILIVDDFLAEGNAGLGLLDICEQAGAKVVGFASVVEKEFQGGHAKLEAKGIKVIAAASVKAFKDGHPVF